jgi:hypothetical protein
MNTLEAFETEAPDMLDEHELAELLDTPEHVLATALPGED